ncbi:MAG TPA: hypothetical protein VKA59_15655 [Vicinamibacterales bacterium]|nr:hypothetical protein [Vicinamibacterales bacterium]
MGAAGVNPVDVNGKGIVYRFDIRDYWGYGLIDTSDPNLTLFTATRTITSRSRQANWI